MSTRVNGVEYDVNARGVIDVTDRYNTEGYMRKGPKAWRIAPPMPEVTGIMIHHWAGWLGTTLDDTTPAEVELRRLDLLADFHSTTWGVGPGYNLVAFPSGRLWAVGKHGTHRAHTKGRRPADGIETITREHWNVVGRAVAAAGNWQNETPPAKLVEAMRRGVEEIRSWLGVSPTAEVYPHRDVPTVNSAGVSFDQVTLCPGDKMMPFLGTIAGRDDAPSTDQYAALARELGVMLDEQSLALEEAQDYLAVTRGWLEQMRARL